jgi:hypothetical protein
MTTTNPNAAQTTRFFTRFSQAEDEVVDARVYVGNSRRDGQKFGTLPEGRHSR